MLDEAEGVLDAFQFNLQLLGGGGGVGRYKPDDLSFSRKVLCSLSKVAKSLR